MRLVAILVPVLASLLVGGCTSEVDKCVSEWEKANPGPDEGGDYCQPFERDGSGKCQDGYSHNKAQTRVEMRLACLRASEGR